MARLSLAVPSLKFPGMNMKKQDQEIALALGIGGAIAVGVTAVYLLTQKPGTGGGGGGGGGGGTTAQSVITMSVVPLTGDTNTGFQITGNVKDSQTGAAKANIPLYLFINDVYDSSSTITTNSSGNFAYIKKFANPGTYKIEVADAPQ